MCPLYRYRHLVTADHRVRKFDRCTSASFYSRSTFIKINCVQLTLRRQLFILDSQLQVSFWSGFYREECVMRKLNVVPVIVALAITVTLAACGGGSTTQQSAQMAAVKVSVSDPTTCSASQGGDFQAVYVAIQDVQINASATAGDNDAGWIDLTPNLKSGPPMQVNLLGIADNQCFLAMLNQNSSGQTSGTSIQPGTYQQIRIMLASNVTQIAQNKCGDAGANCVVVNSGLVSNTYPLQLSSEAQTGIKIPSGQIAGGSFVVGPGETKDLNIDFNTCASIVQAGNGAYRLKPVLHAGEATLTSTSINGTLVDANTNQPITGQNVVVLLEKNGGSGTDSLYMEVKPNNLGQFDFCPVTDAGPFDLVAVAMDDNGTMSYATTVVTGVQPGNTVGNMKMYPQTVTGVVSQAPASIKGLVSTSTGSAGISEDVTIRALQLLNVTPSLTVIVPLGLQSASGLNITTPDATACSGVSNAFCQTYTIAVPAANATVAAFATSNMNYVQNTTSPVAYTVDATATGCTPSEMTSNQLVGGGPLDVTAGQTSTAATIQFTSCK
jgi:hypothetical protein